MEINENKPYSLYEYNFLSHQKMCQTSTQTIITKTQTIRLRQAHIVHTNKKHLKGKKKKKAFCIVVECNILNLIFDWFKNQWKQTNTKHSTQTQTPKQQQIYNAAYTNICHERRSNLFLSIIRIASCCDNWTKQPSVIKSRYKY